jgi:tellurite methyltransferase
MVNKKYWDEFYKKDRTLTYKSSNFSKYVLQYIRDNNFKGELVDIGCGNGKDLIYFYRNGMNVTGIDLSSTIHPILQTKFVKDDIISYDYSKFNMLYLRFVVHSLKEDELDKFLQNVSKNKNQHIFIETRSSTVITNEDKSETFFKSCIGDTHFRMLYSKNYLTNKLSSYFNIIESNEGLYSPFRGENPYCLRFILNSCKK